MTTNLASRIRSASGCLAVLIGLAGLSPAPASGARGDDLLKPGQFVKAVKAAPEQAGRLTVWIDSIRAIIADHQWEHGKRTNEGRLWQGFVPGLKDLHRLRSQTGAKTDAYLDSIRSVLTPKQSERLQRILKKVNLLGYPVRETPFHHLSTSPLRPKFKDRTKAYRIEQSDEPTVAATWSYEDLLETWTVTNYVRRQDAYVNQSLVQSSDIQVDASSPSLRSLIVRSPLIVAATLMSSDLTQVEFDILYEHYPHTFQTREAAWKAYTSDTQNHLLVRLKLSTPNDAYFLATDRYIIFLEDSEGNGFEPDSIVARPVRRLEALEIRVPGQTVTYTDVFGTYTGEAGRRETRTLSNPGKIRYAGQERLIELRFPKTDFSGKPIVNSKTRELRLIIQPELENLPRMELTWELKRKPKQRK